MISGKQVKQILEYSFTAGTGFLAPSSTFIATPSLYTVDTVPGSVILSGVLLVNDGLNITWTITNAGGTVLTSGSVAVGVSVANISHSLGVIPSSASSNIYNLNVTYEDTTGTTFMFTVPTTVTVTASAKIGQLDNPTDNILVAADLVPFEAGLTLTTQDNIINLFSIVASNTARIVIVIPNAYGTVTDISDNTDSSVLAEFNVVNDGPGARKIYVGTLPLTPATYYYKITF
jgi:hypothetical protein